MRRIYSLVFALLLLAVFAAVPVQASEISEETTYFTDGSYVIITITEIPSRAAGTKTGAKSARYYSNSNELEYAVTVTGTFSYNGTSSQCTSADGTTSITNTNKISLASESFSKSGAVATYTVTINHKVLGIVIGKETHSISLTCDKDGNLS